MDSRTDQDLLREYAKNASEPAFSELVRRYVDLVYSASLRMVRDPHLAEDVSQRVFIALGRNAGSLDAGIVLSGWLHRTAHHISANVVRSDVRRRAREEEAVIMNQVLSPEPDPSWESIMPQFDEFLSELSPSDRDALLLRYFQQKSAHEIGVMLGITSEAAQKRVGRAIERLRNLFAKRGIAVGASGLAMLITANAVQGAPPQLAVAISGSAIKTASLHSTTAITTTKLIAMTTLQKTSIAAIVLGLIGTAFYQVRRPTHLQAAATASLNLRPLARPAEVPKPDLEATVKPVSRRTRLQRIPPSGPANATSASAARPFPSTQMYQFLKTKAPNLSLTQLESYLNGKGRSAAALLAAFRTTSEPSLLAEAMEKYPTNALVAFEAAIRNGISAEERQQWLDAVRQAAPENSLGSYLSADAHFKAGQTDVAIQDLMAASGLPELQHYSVERVQDNEEAYLAAGYTPGEAKLLANNFLATPYLLQLRDLGQELVTLATAYQAAGDQSSREAALQTAVNLGRRLTEPAAGEPLNSQLIGINIERTALAAMDPTAPCGTDGQTVRQRLDQLAQQKEAIHMLTSQADPLWQTLSDQDWIDYHAQLTASGEEKALQWLVSNYASR